MISKVVIPVAGLGTRLLTATKEMPKEMLPVFDRGVKGGIVLKPVLQIVFERLYEADLRKFCFIVGRGKRVIEDHFTVDESFIDALRSKNKNGLAEELEAFYQKILTSHIVMVNQPEPKGLGDAIAKAEVFTSNEPFLVHAGDDLVLSGRSHIDKLVEVFEDRKADAVLLAEKVKDPSIYGVITGIRIEPKLYEVADLVEKPKIPKSNLAIIAIYAFGSRIYESIEHTMPDEKGEIQLTDAIKQLIVAGGKVYAVELSSNEKRVDVGSVESYWAALGETFRRYGTRYAIG